MRVVEQAAAHEMAIVGVAVVGRARRDDRLQRRRTLARDLQRVEAAPGDAHHADRAAAPGLRGEPGDHLDGVGLLLRQIFVGEQPVGIAGAAHVDAHRRIAVAGELGMHLAVAQHRAVAAPIGQIFEDRRHRIAALRPPAARSSRQAACRRQARSIRSRWCGRGAETRFVFPCWRVLRFPFRSGGKLAQPRSNCKCRRTRLRCRHRSVRRNTIPATAGICRNSLPRIRRPCHRAFSCEGNDRLPRLSRLLHLATARGHSSQEG